MKLSVEDVLKRGIEAHKAGDSDQASRFYVSIIKARPDHPDANHNQGLLFLESDQLEHAEILFKKSLDFDPSVSQFWLSYIDVLGKLKKFDQAEALLNDLKKKQTWGKSLSMLESQIQDSKEGVIPPHKGKSNKKKKIKLSSAKITSDNNATSYIRKGDKYLSAENINSAIGNYRRAIKLSPRASAAHSNLAFALHKQGELKLAEEHWKTACDIDPTFANTHFNLGNLYLEKEQFEQAAAKFETAVKLQPDYTEALIHFGVALQKQGKLRDAINQFEMAIAADPGCSDGHYNIGVIHHEAGNLSKAAPFYLEALKLNPENNLAKPNLAISLRLYRFEENRTEAHRIILGLLEEGWARPSAVSPAIVSLIKHQQVVQTALEKQGKYETAAELSETLKGLSEVTLLVKILELCCVPDLDIEKLLTKIRRAVLENASEIDSTSNLLAFVSALALQCFINEYLYLESEQETKQLLNLESKICEDSSSGTHATDLEILILACYRPLNSFSFSSKIASSPDTLGVYTQQITEPDRENVISASIENSTIVTDEISAKVQDQYETYPYPRWVLPFKQDRQSFVQAADRIHIRIDSTVNDFSAPKILIAGCGTGQHSTETALKYNNSEVVAIDLSKSSLAYAIRKADELGVENIKYLHADILQAKQLNQEFDVIESSGVLHHMRDPIQGWQILSECLRPGGVMSIGLYSKLARRYISEIKKYIKANKIADDPASIKLLRQSFLLSDKAHHQSMFRSADFFGLSSIHDLLFNVQEHLFTIPQIQEALSRMGLVFCGFENPRDLVAHIEGGIDESSIHDLQEWDSLESNNPNLFIEMYQFWCQKTE